jgi:hypothetical protein
MLYVPFSLKIVSGYISAEIRSHPSFGIVAPIT